MVIGPPGAGKTSLVHRLLNKPLEYYLSTKGTEVHCGMITMPHHWVESDLDYQIMALSRVTHDDFTYGYQQTIHSSYISVTIYDINGDDCHSELLPFLLSPQDIVLLVYKASEVLANKSFDSIDYFLQSICSHCSTECCSDNPNPIHWPRIVMVGTHLDFLSSKSTHNLSTRYFTEKLFVKHIDAHRFINIYGGEINHIQDAILSAAKPLYKKQFPLAYFKFEQNILRLHHRRTRIKKEEASAIANQCGIAAVESLFKYCRNKGIILYYPQVESLQGDIFVPSKIIKLLSAIIGGQSPSIRSSSVISIHNSFALFSEPRKRLAVYLLTKFRLASPLPAAHMNTNDQASFDYGSETYLIPSLLKRSKAKLEVNHAEITYYFFGEFLPKCFFHQLLASTIHWCYDENHKIVR